MFYNVLKVSKNMQYGLLIILLNIVMLSSLKAQHGGVIFFSSQVKARWDNIGVTYLTMVNMETGTLYHSKYSLFYLPKYVCLSIVGC